MSKPPRQSPSHRVNTTAELRALASPASQELMAGLQALQPCTVSDLGEHLGRLPVSLYYHVRKLEAVGLVVEHGQRGSEALYRLRAREVRIDPEERGGANLQALRKIGAGMFRLAMRLHDAAVGEKPARRTLRREHLLSQCTLRLNPDGLERVNAKLRELLELLDEESSGPGEAFYTLTLHLAPNLVRGE